MDVSAGQVEKLVITRSDTGLFLPVYASRSLEEPDESVERAVIVVHGRTRNAEACFGYAAAALKGASGVVLVAPRFCKAEDEPAESQLHWASSGWSSGSRSVAAGRPWRISSFAVMARLIRRLRSTFVNLGTVVLIGHSAGGQFVCRYAATNTDASLRFVVMNPSSYLYLTPERPAMAGGFCVPEEAPADYDDYKYGLNDLRSTSYMGKIGADALRTRFAAARVRYLLGTEDNQVDDDLDTTAPAMLQGDDRLSRGEAFLRYLGFTFGPSIYERHSRVLVKGVGHSVDIMMQSAEARAAMLQ